MIAILASEYDEAACALAREWAAEGAVLVSARDLCTAGWVFHAPEDTDGAFVAGGQPHPTRALRGVLVRRPAVAVEELRWISGEDREYAAAEINAFLVAWLSALPCTVLNRPTPTSLCGPAWSQAHWEIVAAHVGVTWTNAHDLANIREIVFCHTGAIAHASSGGSTCAVAGSGAGRCEPTGLQWQASQRLAEAAGVNLLGVRFSGDAVAAVTLQPSLAMQETRDLLRAHLAAPETRGPPRASVAAPMSRGLQPASPAHGARP